MEVSRNCPVVTWCYRSGHACCPHGVPSILRGAARPRSTRLLGAQASAGLVAVGHAHSGSLAGAPASSPGPKARLVVAPGS